MLPADKQLAELLPEHFILFKPRDIVSGDFYWFRKFDNLITLAVADCTGHGVPGAFMSIVAHNTLNKAIDNNKNIKENHNYIYINPNQKGCQYRYKNLSVSGLTFKLMQAIAIYYNIKSISGMMIQVDFDTIKDLRV